VWNPRRTGTGLVLAAGERKVLVVFLVLREGDTGSGPPVHLDRDGGRVERRRPGAPPAAAYLARRSALAAREAPARAVPGAPPARERAAGPVPRRRALERSVFPP
jgi:hypothetical protein